MKTTGEIATTSDIATFTADVTVRLIPPFPGHPRQWLRVTSREQERQRRRMSAAVDADMAEQNRRRRRVTP